MSNGLDDQLKRVIIMIVTQPTTESLDKIELGEMECSLGPDSMSRYNLRKPDGSYIIQTGDQDNLKHI